MHLFLFTIFLGISFVQTFDYDDNNQQTCTHTPFVANFYHNCSRTRLIQDVNIPNTDQILYISILFETTLHTEIFLNITKSSKYNQKIYFTFFTIIGRYLYINNQTIMTLNNTSINSYIYNTWSGLFIPSINSISYSSSGDPYCILKDKRLFLSTEISRIYYLSTNETDLHLDLSKSSYLISPFCNRFDTCFTTEISLTVLAIVLIVIISVLSLITIVLVGICLKKQLSEWYIIRKNWIRQRIGLIPDTIIDNEPSS